MKSSRKVVKSPEITTRNLCPDLFVEYHIEPFTGNKKTAEQRQPMTNADILSNLYIFFEILTSSVLPSSAACSFRALSSCCNRFVSVTASSNPRSSLENTGPFVLSRKRTRHVDRHPCSDVKLREAAAGQIDKIFSAMVTLFIIRRGGVP